VSSCGQSYSTGQWNFNSQVGSLGNSWGYSFNGIPVTAYGYSNNGSSAGLCGHNDGGTSNGLGIQGTSGNYIDANHWVALDLSQALATGATGGQITIGGLSYGEGYSIWGSNALGQIGTQLSSGGWSDNGNPVNIPSFGQYKYINVKATSGNCLVSSVNFTTTACKITISTPAISLTCAASAASEGVAYSSTVGATGGTAPYTFSVASGSLPQGLTLNPSTGAITGTPTTAGTYSYTVKVTDSKGNTAASASCGITVTAPPTLTIACPTGSGIAGTAYASGAVAAGGVPPYTFSIAAGSLPPGLALNATTGAITGTPTTAGTYNFTIKVTDSFGGTSVSSCGQSYSTGQWNFNSQVGSLGNSWGYSFNGIPVTAYGYSNNGSSAGLCGHNDGGTSNGLGIQGTSGNYIDANHWVALDLSQALATGATGGQITIGGLSYGEGYSIWGSNALGQIGTQLSSGGWSDNGNPVNIPSFGQYKYINVKATSGNCLVSSVNFTTTACQITIAAPPTVTAACAAISASKGIAITPVALTATGGSGAPYTFSANGLPAGMSMSSSGTISGTPSGSGTFSYSVSIRDKAGNTGTINCTITVSAASTPSCKVYQNASPPYMTYQDTGVGLVRLNVNTNLNNNFNVTVSPAPAGTTYSPAVPSQPYAMPAGEVITFPQPTTGLVTVSAARINSSKSAQLTVTATNAAGATVTCDPISTVVSSLSWNAGLNGLQTFSNLSSTDHIIEITNGNPGLQFLAVVVNNIPFIEWNLTNGQAMTVDVSSAMQSGNNNTIVLAGIGFSQGATAQVVISQ
jgi:hypothetical protein